MFIFPGVNYSDYVVQEAADLGLVCVPMALFDERLGDTYARDAGATYNFDDGSMNIPSEPSQGTYSLINPEFPGVGPVVDSFLDQTLEDFGAFHYGVPVNPACSTPKPYRSPSPGLQRTFDINRPHGATFNAGRNCNTFDLGRNNNTFNAGRANNTFNVGRRNNTFDVGRGGGTFNAGNGGGTFNAGYGGYSPGLEHLITPVMNETYEINEGDECQQFPSDITHGTYDLGNPEVCSEPTLSSGGFYRDAPMWPAQSSPKPRTPRQMTPISTPRRRIRPVVQARRLNFDDLSESNHSGSPGSYLANFNRLSREFVDEILCDATHNLSNSPARRNRTV